MLKQNLKCVCTWMLSHSNPDSVKDGWDKPLEALLADFSLSFQRLKSGLPTPLLPEMVHFKSLIDERV